MSINTGHLVIEPPLNWAEIRKAAKVIQNEIKKSGWGSAHAKAEMIDAAPEALAALMGFGLRVTETIRETDEGDLQVKACAEVSYYHREDGCRTLAEETIITAIVKAAPGHQVNGVLMYLNEDSEAGSKLVVKNGKTEKVSGKAYIKWADGTEIEVAHI